MTTVKKFNVWLMMLLGAATAGAAEKSIAEIKKPQLTLQQIKNDFKGIFCYVHARAAMTPDGLGVMTSQLLYLKGCDDFSGLEMRKSTDHGKTWSSFKKSATLIRKKYKDGYEMVMCDATPVYHKKTGKIIIIGHSAVYRMQGKTSVIPRDRPRQTLWSVYDTAKDEWAPYQELKMPEGKIFHNCGSGSAQVAELDNGDLLIPVYAASAEELAKRGHCYSSFVLKCSFDGKELKLKEIGKPLSIRVPRGLYEPSVVSHKGKYFLALRNDRRGYVACSDDGLNYSAAEDLRFDDGKLSGNYCTQQHWITGGGKLYMVYTRRDAKNNHVFRHRAPLYMAEFDPERMCLIRSTEIITIPERGARLGNFGCMQVNENEAWVIAAEWMQTKGPRASDYTVCMKYGSDNSIWIAKIKFPPEASAKK